jgi:hypothetical protein
MGFVKDSDIRAITRQPEEEDTGGLEGDVELEDDWDGLFEEEDPIELD